MVYRKFSQSNGEGSVRDERHRCPRSLLTNYERGSFLEKAGYTSLPGSKDTNWGVGRACGDLLAAAAKK
jgi:hypothetical protein